MPHTPEPTTGHWHGQAACRTVDPELFHPIAVSGSRYREQVDRAKAICARCPVRRQCLAFALQTLPHGIAGGTTEEERRRHPARTVSRERQQPSRHTARPVAATRSEIAIAGRGALRAGQTVHQVATTFGVSPRTAQRWARRVRTATAGART